MLKWNPNKASLKTTQVVAFSQTPAAAFVKNTIMPDLRTYIIRPVMNMCGTSLYLGLFIVGLRYRNS